MRFRLRIQKEIVFFKGKRDREVGEKRFTFMTSKRALPPSLPFPTEQKKRKEAEEVDGDARDEISRFLESSFLTWNCKVAGMAIVKSFCYP